MMWPILGATCLALVLTSCEDPLAEAIRVDDVRFDAEFAIPLIDSRVNLTELVGDVDERVTVTVEADGLLRFNYRDTVPAVTSEVAFDELSDLARGIPLSITKRRQALAFPVPDELRVDKLLAKRGTFTYSLPNTYARTVTVELTLPTVTRDGEPLRVTGTLPPYIGSGTVPSLSNVDTPIDVAGYTLDFSSDSLVIEYRMIAEDGTDLDPPRNTLAVFRDLEFSFIEGYFRRQPYPGVSDVLEIDFFNTYEGGEVSFVEPRIVVEIRNGFGVPARAVIEQLEVITVEGDTLAVTGRAVEEGFDFDFPRTPGQTAATRFVIDNSNSNLTELIASKPVQLNYRISALINPDADADITGFLSDTSTYQATVNVELPLYGTASDFRLRDSFPLNLGTDYAEITAASFRVTTDNAIPFDLALTGTFLDSLGNALFDLTDGQLLVVAAGEVAEIRQVTTDFAFDDTRLPLLRQASTLVLRTSFATGGGGEPVRITDDQQLRVRIGTRLTVTKE